MPDLLFYHARRIVERQPRTDVDALLALGHRRFVTDLGHLLLRQRIQASICRRWECRRSSAAGLQRTVAMRCQLLTKGRRRATSPAFLQRDGHRYSWALEVVQPGFRRHRQGQPLPEGGLTEGTATRGSSGLGIPPAAHRPHRPLRRRRPASRRPSSWPEVMWPEKPLDCHRSSLSAFAACCRIGVLSYQRIIAGRRKRSSIRESSCNIWIRCRRLPRRHQGNPLPRRVDRTGPPVTLVAEPAAEDAAPPQPAFGCAAQFRRRRTTIIADQAQPGDIIVVTADIPLAVKWWSKKGATAINPRGRERYNRREHQAGPDMRTTGKPSSAARSTETGGPPVFAGRPAGLANTLTGCWRNACHPETLPAQFAGEALPT